MTHRSSASPAASRSTLRPSIRSLLAGIVDYAGLFPPASLAMAPAVAEYAAQRGGDEAWMLARFIVPVSRLDEFEAAMSQHRREDDTTWPLSALPGTELGPARKAIDAFHERVGDAARVESIEMRAPSADDISRGARTFDGFEVYYELDHRSDPRPLMEAVAQQGGAAKIRTGAVVADAIPTTAEVARFLRTAAEVGIPLKATAGLHHPVRAEHALTYEDDAPRGVMHGFLNVFLAAALARSRDQPALDEATLEDLLDERDPRAFAVSGDAVSWRGHTVDSASLDAARHQFAHSFGSCSFAEPVDDLRALRLL
ncbi:MAG: hypothetical protein AAGC60_28820 [Acidobacteriota bacterium]